MHWQTMTQGAFWGAAVAAAAAGALWRAPAHGVRRSDAFALFGLMGVAAILGARLFGWGAAWATGDSLGWDVLWRVQGAGMASLGAAAGAGGVVCAVGWRTGRLGQWCDLFVPVGLVSLAIARLGCMASGCDFGVPAPHAPGAVHYAEGAKAWGFFARHDLLHHGVTPPLAPFPLYLSAATLISVALAAWGTRDTDGAGAWAWWSLVGYTICRVALEELRHPSSAPPLVWGLNLNQWVLGAVLLVLICCAVARNTWRRNAPLNAPDSRS